MPTRHAELRFCPLCGANALTQPESKQFNCTACGFSLFLNSAAAAGAILTDGDRILFTVRAKEPMRGFLDLPGGFVDHGEGIEDGLRRELREELGIEVGALRYVGSWPNIYPFGGVTYRTCDVIFTASITGLSPHALDEVSALEWHQRDQLPIERVGFPSLRAALRHFIAPD